MSTNTTNDNMETFLCETLEAQERKHITIMKGEVFRPEGTSYKLDSIESVADLIKAKGSKEHSVIFYNDRVVGIVLDDSIMDKPKDRANYHFELSNELKAWKNLFGPVIDQRSFVNFLKQRKPEEVKYVEELMAKIQNLKIATEILGDYQYDDNNNFTVMFKTKDGEKNVTLPSSIYLSLPFLYGSNKAMDVEIEMELVKPRSENEKPGFKLTCLKYDQYLREAVEHEIKRLKEMLPGYLILAGAVS